MSRVFNFSAGPCTLPLPALERAQAELLDYQGTGMSIIEHSHRGKAYDAVHFECMELVHSVLGVPQEFKVVFLGGGASLQFLMAPMNLVPPNGSADYVVTGAWAKKALKEAKGVANARVAATSAETNFDRIPTDLDLAADAAYLHVTSNNTIFGTQWRELPALSDRTVVCDMSSDIASHPVDFTHLDLVYAGAQKNLGPAGVALVLIRESLLEKMNEKVPTMLAYKTHVAKDSLFNTPPVFAIYMMKLVLEWVRDEGGLTAMAERTKKRAGAIYGAVDGKPDFYRGTVETDSRSTMNVTFRLPTEELEAQFIAEAGKKGFVGLKGHRDVGGVRVSMYNAMPVAGAEGLATFMNEFAGAHA